MDIEKKTDKQILVELENMYQRIAEESIGDISPTHWKELSEIEPEKKPPKIREQPPQKEPEGKPSLAFTPIHSSKKTSPRTFQGTIFFALSTLSVIFLAIFIWQTGKWNNNPIDKIPTYKKEETKNNTIIEPIIEKPYTIQISAIRNFEVAKNFLKKIKVSQPDVHWDRFNSKKYGVLYRVFIGHFADRTEAIKYMKEKKIGKSYPGSHILLIPASAPKK